MMAVNEPDADRESYLNKDRSKLICLQCRCVAVLLDKCDQLISTADISTESPK